MKKLLLILCIASLSSAAPACAAVQWSLPVQPAPVRPASESNCNPLPDNVIIAVNFLTNAKTFSEAKSLHDEKMKQAEEFARRENIDVFELINSSYTLNSQQVLYEDSTPIPGMYVLKANYRTDTLEHAFVLAQHLADLKLNVTVTEAKPKYIPCKPPVTQRNK